MSDEDLIRRFTADGDSDAFEELIRRHLPSIRRIVAAAGPRRNDEREDVLQEVLIRLYRSLSGYRFDAPLHTWIYRITRNVSLDEEKKRRRARNRELKVYKADPQSEKTGPGPEEHILQEDRTRELRSLFFRLPEQDRQLLLLREREELSMDEIAGILGLPAGTVKSRLSRARRRARRLYEGEA